MDDPLGDQPDFLEAQGDAIGVSLRAPKMSITVPDEAERMLLTEEQVTILCNGGRDLSFDWSLALFGATLGFLQNLLSVLRAVYNNTTPSMLDTVLALVCVLCLAGAVAKFTEHRRNKTDIDSMLIKLKSGRKISVS